MDSGKCGIDPIEIQTIRDRLETQFADVKFSQNIRPTFIFNDGKLSWHLVFNEEFVADLHSIDELRQFVELKVIRKILNNPGKRIQVSKLGDVTVEEKDLS